MCVCVCLIKLSEMFCLTTLNWSGYKMLRRGRLMNYQYGTVLEYWHGRTEVLGKKLVPLPPYSRQAHMDWSGIERRLPRLEVSD